MTEAPAAVENHPCDVCGQLDNHPMIHVSGVWQKDDRTVITAPSFHFDCIPVQFEDLLGTDDPQHAVTVAGIAAARDGVHGDDLRALLLAQPDDNSLEVGSDG